MNRFFDPDFHITKQSFATVIAKMLSFCSPAWVKSGFESTGIYPLDKTRVTIHNFESAFTNSNVGSVVVPNKPDERSSSSSTDTLPVIVDCPIKVDGIALQNRCDKISYNPSTSHFDTFSTIVESPLPVTDHAGSIDLNIDSSTQDSPLLSTQNVLYNDETNDSTSFSAFLTQTVISRYNDAEISISLPDVDFPIPENSTELQVATACSLKGDTPLTSANVIPLSQKSTVEINSLHSFPSELNENEMDVINMTPVPISTFKIQSSRFLMTTPLQKFSKIIGNKKFKEFENLDFEKNLNDAGKFLPGDTFELTKQMYATYVMLKEYEEFLKKPPTLQQPTPPKRKYIRNTKKKPFVITSQKWIDITQEEINSKKNDLEEKENRKIKRQENQIRQAKAKQDRKRKLTETENEEEPKTKINKNSFSGRI